MLESRYFVTVLVVTCFTTEIYSQHPKVIGGRNANEGEFPFQVSVQHYRIREHMCGGVIINAKMVLSTSHCLEGKIARSLIAVAGIHRLSDQAKAIVRHGDRTFLDCLKKTPKEVALLRIKCVFPFRERNLSPVPIMTGSADAGATLTVVGWGISEPGKNADALQVLEMVFTPDEQCKDRLSRISEKYVASRSAYICAMPNKEQGCHGDQGATLLVSGKVLGISSGKIDNCATTGEPSVFSTVGDIRRWVKLAMSGAPGMYTSPTWIELSVLLFATKIAMEI